MSERRSAVSKGQSVEELTEQNVEKVTRLEQAAREQRTPADRIAEHIAHFCGSMKFVWVHVIWFGGWILFNSIPGLPHVDPFPFTFLTLIVSLEAIFLTLFVLISQNRMSREADHRAELDLQVNVLAEQEATMVLRILHDISHHLGVKGTASTDLAELLKETRLDELSKKLDKALPEDDS